MTENLSFAKSLFLGRVPEDEIFPFPELREDERESLPVLLESLRKFLGEKVDAVRIDREKTVPEEVRRGLGELGILGMTFPEEFGGFGMSQTAFCRVCEELATTCASTGIFVGGHSSIGSKALVLYGTKEQKEKFLPKLATGEWVACYALTEPEAGSDAMSMRTTARLSDDKTHYVLNGSKQWITNGAWADVFTIFARVEGEGADGRIGCLILTKDMEGLVVGKNEDKLGLRGSCTTSLTFEDVRVPVENLVGRVGEGFKIALDVLTYGRMSLGASCIGAARRMIREAALHAAQRKQFGRPIAEFEMIQEKLWRMAMGVYVLESAVYLTSGLCDGGAEDFQMESAVCKTYGSEALWDVINDAVQTVGGNGYMTEYPYERFLRDARINLIFEGTNEIQRLLIATLGLQEVRRAVRRASKGAETSGAGGKTAALSKPHAALRDEAGVVAEFAEVLAKKSEALVQRLGKEIREREILQERFADMLIDLYCLSATLSRVTRSVEQKGEKEAADEILIAKTFAREARHRFLRNAAALDEHDDESRLNVARRVVDAADYPWSHVR
ncbi:MAG: acyl-CoA dehydrogenase family protein [Acidobacteriota bacterium]|nr:MAG: acyl-CoA dehydrogenase family protein [Acidobacteriota bacterium]